MSACDWASAVEDVFAAAAWLRQGQPAGSGSMGGGIVGCSFGVVLAICMFFIFLEHF